MFGKSARLPTQWFRIVVVGCLVGVAIWLVEELVRFVLSGEFHPPGQAVLELLLHAVLLTGLFYLMTRQRHVVREYHYLLRALDQSASLVMITDVQGRIQYVNARFIEVTGYTLDDLRHHPTGILKTDGGDAAASPEFRAALRTGQQWRGESYLITRDGQRRWVQSSITPIRDANGTITHFLGINEDITARKEAEAAEDEQRLFAGALRDSAAALTRTLDLEQVLDGILVSLEPLVPHDAAEILLIVDGVARSVRFCRHVSPEARAAWARLRLPVDETSNLREMATTGQPLVVADVRQHPGWRVLDEATAWIRSYVGAPIYVKGQAVGFLGFYCAEPDRYTAVHAGRLMAFADQAAIAIRNAQLYRAVQDQASALAHLVAERTAQLEQQRTQLQAILDSMGEGVAYIEDGQIQYVNRALLELLGYDPGADASQLYAMVVRAMNRFQGMREEAREAFAGGAPWRGRTQLARRDGKVLDLALTETQVRDASGRVTGVVVLVRDISQEIAFQARKDRFLMHAAHEFRTPVSNLKVRLYLLQRQPERTQAHLTVMDKIAREMEGLIEDLLDVVRVGRNVLMLRCAPVDLADLLTEVIVLQVPEAERNDVMLAYELPDQPVTVCADRRRLGQVFANLVNNAIYSTAPGGYVTVELDYACNEDAPAVVISVRDSGRGIDPDDLPHVFEPFFRAEEADSQGLSLGLALAKEIVDLHGGQITVESTPGEGSVFTVRLALLEDEAECAPSSAEPPTAEET